MSMKLAQPLDLTDPLLLLDLTGIAASLKADSYFAECWQKVRPVVRLRDPHMTAQADKHNEPVDARFDWDAQVEAAA